MKIDLHVHTSEISGCGKIPAAETVDLYKEAGYDAIVITNHYGRYNAERFLEAGYPDFHKVYMDGYALAKEEGDKVGLKVFCGYELRFDNSDNDYLVFGMDDETASDCDNIFRNGVRAFSKLASEKGILLYQAHPFRNGMTIVRPGLLFGIEVLNGNPRHDSRNDIAKAWAEKFSLREIGGSDCHEYTDVGISGIITDRTVNSMDDLVAVLRDDDYTVIR